MITKGKECGEPPTPQRPDVYKASPPGANSPSPKRRPYDGGDGHTTAGKQRLGPSQACRNFASSLATRNKSVSQRKRTARKCSTVT